TSPILALLAPGAMGAAIATRLSASGAGLILTNLDGRSEPTIQRARASNMQHASYTEIVERASYIYSVVPPKDAFAIATSDPVRIQSRRKPAEPGVYEEHGDTISQYWNHSDRRNVAALDEFTRMSNEFGLNVIPLKGEGADIGDASAVKMSHSGIVKGTIGLFTTMILAANAASPSTADGLLHALNLSQPALVDLGGFAAGTNANTFDGLAKIFARVAQGGDSDLDVLLKFAQQAKETRESESASRV
ncbi:6-phosphogluconate dehydrogenase C-terminal domain-like protein, partial [Mycena olivaceomarginata]